MKSGKAAILATVVLGVIVVGVGCHAFFESEWNKAMKNSEKYPEGCKQLADVIDEKCPSLLLEMYFVSISIITLILSAGLLIISHYKVQNDSIKRVGAIYNIGAAVLIFIGAIALMVSAVQVHGLLAKAVSTSANKLYPGIKIEIGRNDGQYFDEKVAAGALSIINAMIYAGAGFIGFKSNG